jgi:hypothetical protein
MNHDPLCSYYKPGVFWESHVCVTCDLIAKVRRDMLAKCIAATESLHFPTDYGEWYGIEAMKGTLVCEHCNDNCHSQSGVMCDSPDALWPCETITVLRALQEKP